MNLKYSKQLKNPLFDDLLLKDFVKVRPISLTFLLIRENLFQIGSQNQNLGQTDELKLKKYAWNKRLDRANDIKVVKFTEALWRFIFYAGRIQMPFYR